MDHIQFLASMKRMFRPRAYLEVGVAAGTTLFSEPIPEFVVGIDPNPQFGQDSLALPGTTMVMRMSSDDAFADLLSNQTLGERRIDMCFIDGLYHSEVVLRDIANCSRLCRDGALLFVRAVFPGNDAQAAREQCELAWMGDVYRVVPIFSRHLSSVPAILIDDVAPSGMFILRKEADLFDMIIRDYDKFTKDMDEFAFSSTIADMKSMAVSCSSPEFAAFLAETLRYQSPPEELTASLLRTLMW
jgi:predicted O-methyltransferase YrrM